MNDLVVTSANLPSNLEDLAQFVLIGREKLTAVRANIRAIDKLQLAEDVREQKKEEAQMLAEALLDAEVKIGDLLKQIPKMKNQYDKCSSQQCEKQNKSFSQNYEKTRETKQEVITRLGFNKDQANRFETLSNNKDIVEQVKAEARENEDIPTRSRVLQLVKEKSETEKYLEEEFRKIEEESAIKKNIRNAIYKMLTVETRDEYLEIWYDGLDKLEMETLEEDLYRARGELDKIIEFVKNHKKIRRLK